MCEIKNLHDKDEEYLELHTVYFIAFGLSQSIKFRIGRRVVL